MVLEQRVPVNQARASANSAGKGKGSLKVSANIDKAFKPPQDVLIASQWTLQSCTSTSHRKSSRQPLMPGLIARKPIEDVYKHIPRPKATSSGAPAGTVWAMNAGRTISNPIPAIEGPNILPTPACGQEALAIPGQDLWIVSIRRAAQDLLAVFT